MISFPNPLHIILSHIDQNKQVNARAECLKSATEIFTMQNMSWQISEKTTFPEVCKAVAQGAVEMEKILSGEPK